MKSAAMTAPQPASRYRDLKDEDIDIIDLAHALSKVVFVGRGDKQFYSAAQHSVLLSQQCTSSFMGALFHHAYRAYLPETQDTAEYRQEAASIQDAIYRAFQIHPPNPVDRSQIHDLDRHLSAAVAYRLGTAPPGLHQESDPVVHLSPLELRGPFGCWASPKAAQKFLSRFMEIQHVQVRYPAPPFLLPGLGV